MNEFSSASEPEEEDQSSENELSDDDGFLAVAASRHEFIRPPDYTEVQPLIMEHSYKYRPWFDVGDPILEEYVADGMPVGEHVDINADYVLTNGGMIQVQVRESSKMHQGGLQ
ncbi:hypothetical protein TIFTF001_024752 [Ficus carica]|uniref:Uncharacterized protein n=1 Tax=Ficus carica TaxID=3494 RepID=A0AA88ANU6_FICCA|nr:hypothetical protein TIFTF001_024752 [Ficus carica]